MIDARPATVNAKSAEIVAWLRKLRAGNLRLHWISIALSLVIIPLMLWSSWRLGLWMGLVIAIFAVWQLLHSLMERRRARAIAGDIRRMAIRNLLDRGLLLQLHEARTPGDLFGTGSGMNLAYEGARGQDMLRDTTARFRLLVDMYPMICRSHGWSWKPGQDDHEQLPEDLRIDSLDWGKMLRAAKKMQSSMNSAERLVLIDTLIEVLDGSVDSEMEADGGGDE